MSGRLNTDSPYTSGPIDSSKGFSARILEMSSSGTFLSWCFPREDVYLKVISCLNLARLGSASKTSHENAFQPQPNCTVTRPLSPQESFQKSLLNLVRQDLRRSARPFVNAGSQPLLAGSFFSAQKYGSRRCSANPHLHSPEGCQPKIVEDFPMLHQFHTGRFASSPYSLEGLTRGDSTSKRRTGRSASFGSPSNPGSGRRRTEGWDSMITKSGSDSDQPFPCA